MPATLDYSTAQRPRKAHLQQGSKMECERCKREHDVLAYVPLKQMRPDLTNPIYKCPSCRWLFSPRDLRLPDA